MKLQKLLLGIALATFFLSFSSSSFAQEPQKKKVKKENSVAKENKSEQKSAIKPGEPVPGAEITVEQESNKKPNGKAKKEKEPIREEEEKRDIERE